MLKALKHGCKKMQILDVINVHFLDSSISLTHKKTNSTIVAPFHQQVNISISVRAYPTNASFQWYFKPKHTAWFKINTSDEKFAVKTTGLTSVFNYQQV